MKRVTLFCGHYGSGKTNLAVNCALAMAREGQKTLIADLDIVNPYFRTRDSQTKLEKAGVKIVVSPYANSNVDVPALPDEMYRVVDDRSYRAVIDVGGDDRGALALGRLAPALKAENDFDMLLVVNFFRPLTQTPESVLSVINEIETASSLHFTGILNNTNLGSQTTGEDVLAGAEKAVRLAKNTGLPLLANCVKEDLAGQVKDQLEKTVPIRLHFRSDWAIF